MGPDLGAPVSTYYARDGVTLLLGDAREVLRELPAESVQCCVCSPPYWGLRDYGADGQLGLEASPVQYIDRMVEVFRAVRRVLRDDGTLWLNLGDSYCGAAGGYQGKNGDRASRTFTARIKITKRADALKPKDLVGIPWRVALALQADGWWLRSDIIWCLSGGAWVYARTQKGDMPITVKDLVRLNPATVQLWSGERWTQARGWNRSGDTDEKIEIVLRSGERVGCTGPHLWPTQRGDVSARDLLVGDVLSTCTLPEPDGAQAPAYLTLDLCWLAGLYLAEGSRSEDTMQLSLHADEERRTP
jgi:DNA methylase